MSLFFTKRQMRNQFNESEYLNANADVSAAVRSGAFSTGLEHYMAHGKSEGRPLSTSAPKNRLEKALYAINMKGVGLEIGPSHNPIAPKCRGFNVQILDHASAQQLRAKYKDHGVNLDSIEKVDFVWSGESYVDLIGRSACYDWIIASHVIEHVPDLVSYLQQCEALLKNNGVLSLVIPDKRYCFDHFSPVTSTGNILDAWAEKRSRPSSGQVFDYLANAAKRKGELAWGADGEGGGDGLVHTLAEAKAHWIHSKSSNDYIDVHCWRFTPASFALIISDLQQLGLIGFDVKAEFGTAGCEFYVSLSKDKNTLAPEDRLTSLQKQKLENA